MQWVFIATAVLGAIYFGFAKRHFDLFTAAFAGAFIYFSPGFFGRGKYLVDDVWPEIEIADITYVVMMLVMVAIVASAILYDTFDSSRPDARAVPRRAVGVELPILGLGALASLAAMLATTGAAVFDADKLIMLEGLNRWHVMFEVCAQVGFCLAVMARRWWWLAVFTLLLLFDVYIGLRVGLAMAIGAAVTARLYEHGRMRILIERKRAVLGGLLAVAFIMVAKGYIGHIKAGSWDYILSNRLDFESVLTPILQNETFVVVSTLNEILVHDFHWDLGAYFVRAGAAIVPFGNALVTDVPPFEFQQVLFPRVDYGMASTPWGQAYSAGGWLFLTLVIALYCAVIALANRFVFRLSLAVQAAMMLALANWCLYIHRNTMEFQLVTEKRFILLAILLVLVRGVVLESRRARQRRADGTPIPIPRNGP